MSFEEALSGKLYQGGTTLAREAVLTRTENGEFTATTAAEDKAVSPARRAAGCVAVVRNGERFFSVDRHQQRREQHKVGN